MGCDIHCYAEKLKDGKWEQITGFVSDWYDKESNYFSSEEFKNSKSPIDRRDYQLFAMLAGVRNNYRIRPIAEPRGCG
jgi:hypothetical protein